MHLKMRHKVGKQEGEVVLLALPHLCGRRQKKAWWVSKLGTYASMINSILFVSISYLRSANGSSKSIAGGWEVRLFGGGKKNVGGMSKLFLVWNSPRCNVLTLAGHLQFDIIYIYVVSVVMGAVNALGSVEGRKRQIQQQQKKINTTTFCQILSWNSHGEKLWGFKHTNCWITHLWEECCAEWGMMVVRNDEKSEVWFFWLSFENQDDAQWRKDTAGGVERRCG